MSIPTAKKRLGSKPFLFPQPAVVLAAKVAGKPTFTTLSFVGVVNFSPAIITIGLGKKHFITQGVLENKAFSINIPSESAIKKVDYVGYVSGDQTDKVDVFESFDGELHSVPIIRDCPINLECKIIKTVDFEKNILIVAEVVQVYADNDVLAQDGMPMMEKIRPLVFSLSDNQYWGIGQVLGKGWAIGREYQPD